jgi:hypothetical protein
MAPRFPLNRSEGCLKRFRRHDEPFTANHHPSSGSVAYRSSRRLRLKAPIPKKSRLVIQTMGYVGWSLFRLLPGSWFAA